MVEWAEAKKRFYEVVVVLQPTSPLRLTEDLDGALDLFFNSEGSESLVSVNLMSEHPTECLEVVDHGWSYLVSENRPTGNRQTYKQNYYFINGAIYIASLKFLKNSKSLIEDESALLFEMPSWRSVDIDDPFGLKLANYISDEKN